MLPLTEQEIRTSFVNASLKERTNLSLPPELSTLNWDKLDYLGWRDAKIPGLGYVFTHLDGVPMGIVLRQSDGKVRSRPQCAWCEDVLLPNDVVLFAAKRAGQAGRNGNTIGTLVCSHFECSANVRKRPPVAYIGFDVEAARQHRIEALRMHVQNFVRDVRDGA
ncbi:FBP domain-containing protein [Subtercola endophyticus]|uniref:FBP domain-containing protein n=1 Tax=Subtercola endophyticus TaxID=2895559 RepID=UPI001E55EAEE|nr:FBP domain-containing protein [Subtercola endophyticus]UFS58444.1 FBP domain-containing protein [Subtercola endophyticus]